MISDELVEEKEVRSKFQARPTPTLSSTRDWFLSPLLLYASFFSSLRGVFLVLLNESEGIASLSENGEESFLSCQSEREGKCVGGILHDIKICLREEYSVGDPSRYPSYPPKKCSDGKLLRRRPRGKESDSLRTVFSVVGPAVQWSRGLLCGLYVRQREAAE